MVKMGCIQNILACFTSRDTKRYLIVLMLSLPASIVFDMTGINKIILFMTSCISIIPLAGIIGDATEQISIYTGSKTGGLLNATMGNIPELFIGIFAVKAGLFSIVKASVIGSITGNMLLVLGFSIFFGGMRYKFQSFDKLVARTNFGLLFLALIGFIIPAAYKNLGVSSYKGLMYLSFGIAMIFLVIYLLGLFFSFYTHKNIFIKTENGVSRDQCKWSIKKTVIYLILASTFLAYEAGLLVESIEYIKTAYNIPEIFLGIIIVPVIGNIAEYTSAILMAVKDRVNLSIEIAIGSSMQMALFVVPLLVLISFISGNPMSYVFSVFELITITCSIGLSLFIFQDGRTNWLEGVELLSAYIIMALAYFFMNG